MSPETPSRKSWLLPAGAAVLLISALSDFVTGTGEDGWFALRNLPPEREYSVYGLRNSMKGVGALPKIVRVKGDGSTNDMGAVEVVAGWRLAAQLIALHASASQRPSHARSGVVTVLSQTGQEIVVPGLVLACKQSSVNQTQTRKGSVMSPFYKKAITTLIVMLSGLAFFIYLDKINAPMTGVRIAICLGVVGFFLGLWNFLGGFWKGPVSGSWPRGR